MTPEQNPIPETQLDKPPLTYRQRAEILRALHLLLIAYSKNDNGGYRYVNFIEDNPGIEPNSEISAFILNTQQNKPKRFSLCLLDSKKN